MADVRQFTQEEEYALSIVTYPLDLQISVLQRQADGKYGFIIIRGPGCGYQMIFRSDSSAETLEAILDEVRGFLQMLRTIIDNLLEELGDPDARFVSRCVEGDDSEVLLCQEMELIDAELIDRIIEELREHQIAMTFKMEV